LIKEKRLSIGKDISRRYNEGENVFNKNIKIIENNIARMNCI